MIKVLKHGYLKVKCPYCKATLQYEQEDIISEKNIKKIRYIVCPDCNNNIILDKSEEEDEFEL